MDEGKGGKKKKLSHDDGWEGRRREEASCQGKGERKERRKEEGKKS